MGDLALVAARLSSPSTKERVSLFRASLSSLLDLPDEHAVDHVPELVAIVLATLHLYDDRASQLAVDSVIIKALKLPAFVKAFTGALVQAAERNAKVCTASTQLKLLRWTCFLVSFAPAVVSARNAFSRIAAVQSSLLLALSQARYRLRLASKALLLRSLIQVNGLYENYVSELEASPSERSGLISVLLEFATRDPALLSVKKAFFVDLYVKLVLGSREKPSKAISEAFEPLFKHLSHDQFGGVVVPAAVRMLKRSPEIVLEAVGVLLKQTPLDLSRYTGEFLPVVLLQCRHNDEGRRREALQTLSWIAQKSGDTDSLLTMVQAIKSILGGSEGKLTFVYQRLGLIYALRAICGAGQGKAVIHAAGVISPVLISLYKDDGNEEVRVAILSSLSSSLGKAERNLPAECSSFFSAGLKEKETMRRAHLRCLRQAFFNEELPILAFPLVDQLIQLAKTGIGKPAQRIDGIYALLLLLKIASIDSRADDKLLKEKIISSITIPESTFFSTVNLKMQTEDCSALIELLEDFSNYQLSRGSNEGLTERSKSLVSFLWHQSWDVRRAAAAAVGRLQVASLAYAKELFESFLNWLPTLHDQLHSQMRGIENDSSPLEVPSSDILSKALLSLGCTSLVRDPLYCTHFLIAFHHDCILRGQKYNPYWKDFARRINKQDGERSLRAVLRSDPGAVWKVLAGANGLTSEQPAISKAAIVALGLVMQMIPDEMFNHFIHGVKDLADWSSHNGLNASDIKIFNTPEGVLSTEGGVYVAEVVVDKNVKQAKGRFKMYNESGNGKDTMAKSASRPSAPRDVSKASKKTGESKPTKEEARDYLLKEEAIVRSRVCHLRTRFTVVLRAIAAVADANLCFVHDHLPALIPLVLPLLKSPIVSDEAFHTMVKLTGSVTPALRYLATDIAAAMKILVSSFSLQIYLDEEKGVVQRVITGIVSACEREPFPAESFTLVFPIVEQVLLQTKKTKFHDGLLRVLSIHCSPQMHVPRSKMISVLYHVLGLFPSYQAVILPILNELSRGISPVDLPETLAGVYSKYAHVRVACLSSTRSVPVFAKGAVPHNAVVASALWIALYDPEKVVADIAEDIWDLYGHDLGNDYAAGILGALSHVNLNVRQAAATALAAAMEEYPSSTQETLSALFTLYSRDLPSEGNQVDPGWPGRQGVALALEAAADILTAKDLPVLSTFLISRALADTNSDVRSKMVEAGVAIIDRHGKDSIAVLLPIFENYLSRKAVDEERYDLVREGVVVFMGALAKHLSQDDPKILVILERLLEMLKTPSESVQRAVSNCLAPLMLIHQVDSEKLAKDLLEQLVQSEKYGERYGAAFGLAGVVKGKGLSCLKKFRVMNVLITSIEDRDSAKAREGALLGFECLSEKLGRLFEPYVIRILPELLVCFSDSVSAVRDAADLTARTIMSQLTGQGVKLVLPALLKGLEDRAWRTKQGSVQLLGAMAFCAPRQLSQCLPTIVPKLSEVLTDTHPKVQAAAQTALQQVGSVIKNPEISALVPLLLVGISDPNEHTKSSLDALLQTIFVNTVDAPALALVVPIVHRGLRERSSETKKKAAQIVGNMCSLVTDYKDMLPYMLLLLPEVKKVLVDPIPEVRSVAAKALGSLTKGMGDDNFPSLVPWLLETLKSENSSVERSGAAQGLSEVLAALGMDYFDKLLPDIIENCTHPRAAVRDGYLTLFKYLPSSLGLSFQTYLPRVLPAILDGLADENESVRDAALSAGHVFVEHYATTSLPQLLPAVEEGIFHDNWRIRQSSVELLGDLLFKVAGTSGKVVLEGGSDDEGASTEAHGRAIVDILGSQRRNEILAALYMLRSDVGMTVRQAALHVWKTVVANTPKTLKEIMPVLMSTLISSLASSSAERRQVAGRSLGELVRKLGDRVLPSIIPILAQGLEDEDDGTRQGVCMGLSEVMASAGKLQLVTYMGELIPTIRTALCDSVSEVREAAGLAFGTLFKSAGMQAIDEIVPSLLGALEVSETSGTALDGLKQILSVRTAAVLPHILPKLVQPPLTAFNAHALGALAEVAGPGLNGHLSTILPPLIAAMDSDEMDVASFAKSAGETVVLAIDGEGLEYLLSELVRGLGDTQASIRTWSAYLTGYLFKNTKLDLSDELPNILTTLVVMLTDVNDNTVKAVWEALASVTATISKENQPSYVKVLRDAVSTARDKERRKRKGGPVVIPGFCLPKGLQPVLPILLQGLMSGSADLREQAAEGIGELVTVTSEAAVKPFVVPITGPLIRIIGDRFTWQVKGAILGTLGIIISKGGIALKPFLPQLQTTFMKCLQDNTRIVRSRAAASLGKLSILSTRVDPLVGDLVTGLQSAEGGVKGAMLVALKGVVRHAGKSLSSAVLDRLTVLLQDLLATEEEEHRILAGKTFGLVSQFVVDDSFSALLHAVLVPGTSWTSRHGMTLALASIIRYSPSRLCASPSLHSASLNTLKTRVKDDKASVRECCTRAFGRLVAYELQSRPSDALKSLSDVLPVLVGLLNDDASDVRRASLSSIKIIAKIKPDSLAARITTLGPAIAESMKDSNTPVRMAAERCAYHVFQLNKGPENTQVAQRYITGLDARRIAKQPEQSDDSDASEIDQ
ncbi:protein ILITYHIA isoform X2 [Selaginella moellendorffii]|uniref:protein ILITYHIA isoform X2 n=1 Tax=Selaginella moellendorffii TaxID=88036 RepID=UPI000D1D0432|nr:protein ILITYHIA isoform X2 [Selaginella moellendorffii]|eukprot:XP_024522570.1 protein ILITYHIA isoform X2 [Selaginella moellendorffii]